MRHAEKVLEWGQQNYPDQFRLGNVKAVKFKGAYYKFDFERDPDIIDWLFTPLSEKKGRSSNKRSDSSQTKNPMFLANSYLQQSKAQDNPEDCGSPEQDFLPRLNVSSIEKHHPADRDGLHFEDDRACMQEL